MPMDELNSPSYGKYQALNIHRVQGTKHTDHLYQSSVLRSIHVYCMVYVAIVYSVIPKF
jgi:hypothetical protein